MFQIMSGEQAISMIKDGDTVAINSFLALGNPEALHAALHERVKETGTPKDLTLYCTAGFGGWDENLYAEPYVKLGAVKRVVAGHFNSMPVVMRMVRENKIEAYNMPLGVLSHCVRAAAAGQAYHLSRIGLNLFVDPRLDGAALNECSKETYVRIVEVDGEEYIAYKTPKIDIAFIRGTTVDPNGNITCENEFVVTDALALAQATKNNGGRVIVQVERVSHSFSRPWNVIVPGVLVDAIVVAPPDAKKTITQYHPAMSGDMHVPATHMDYWMGQLSATDKRRNKPDHSAYIIGERAMRELKKGDIVNIGIGIPEQVGKAASQSGILKDITLTVEAGGTGGLPAPGVAFGATIGADMITPMATQFDFYDGGGLDICFMGGLEVDRHGNVNAHKLAESFPGIGGFANITSATKCVVFCLTFCTKGLVAKRTEHGGVEIECEGALKKFKREIAAISFSAKNALKNKQRVLYVTERCVFTLTERGLKLLEVYDGIREKEDVRALLDFPV